MKISRIILWTIILLSHINAFSQGKIVRNESRPRISQTVEEIPVPECIFNNFSEGLCVFTYHGRYGVIDTTGKIIIAPQDKILDNFHSGMSVFRRKNSSCGYVNTVGEIVINSNYIGIESFDGDIAPVTFHQNGFTYTGRKGFIDKSGKMVIPFSDYTGPLSEGLILRNKINGFIDTKGNLVISLPNEGGDGGWHGYFKNNYAIVELNKNGLQYYKIVINKKGEILNKVKPNHHDGLGIISSEFSEGVAWQKIAKGINLNTYNAIEPSGRVILTVEAAEIRNFSEGLAAVMDENKKWGFIDHSGNIIVPNRYKAVGDFYNGMARVQDFNGKIGFINKRGEEIIPTTFDWLKNDSRNYSDGLVVLEKDGKSYIYNTSGTIAFDKITK